MSNTETCLECGKPGIQGQLFSGGQEYYCPNCEEVYSYAHVREPSPQTDMVAFFDTAIELVEDDCDEGVSFIPLARLEK